MPFKSSKILIANSQYDRRIKLTDDQREYIRWLREEECMSYGALAKKFGVSKRTIVFVCKPESYEKSKADCRKRHNEGRYKLSKEEWAETVREHRRYKENLHKQGLI